MKSSQNVIEEGLERITSHPLFLDGVATVLNLSAYRKIWVRKVLKNVLSSIEIPHRTDQENTLATIEELKLKIGDLQRQIEALSSEPKDATLNIRKKRSQKSKLTAVQ